MPLEEIGTLLFPYSLVEESPGFSFDFGGSVLKVIYRHKDDWAKVQLKQEKKAPLRLVSFPGHEIDDAIKLLKDNCYITQSQAGKLKVYVTGLGGHTFCKKFEEELGISLDILHEMDCFANAFMYMVQHYPKAQLFFPISDEIKIKASKMKAPLLSAMEKMIESDKDGNKMSEMSIDEGHIRNVLKELKMDRRDCSSVSPQVGATAELTYADTKDVFPCMVSVLGSSFSWIQVEKDGSYCYLDMTSIGGKTFLGAGRMQTGAKDFSELIALAEKGNSRNIDEYSSDHAKEDQPTSSDKTEDQKENAYDVFADNDILLFSFGKGASPDAGEFKKEDLAASLLQRTCMSTAHLLLYAAQVYNLKQIYFVGSFINSEIARNELYQQLIYLHCKMAAFSPGGKVDAHVPDLGFVKGGSHCGALGAFLHTNKVKTSSTGQKK